MAQTSDRIARFVGGNIKRQLKCVSKRTCTPLTLLSHCLVLYTPSWWLDTLWALAERSAISDAECYSYVGKHYYEFVKRRTWFGFGTVLEDFGIDRNREDISRYQPIFSREHPVETPRPELDYSFL